ncbi:MAG: hypothetical protein JWP47_2266 [Polaromonas sp.]|nr:hypothetical protein [Polaromonas sp.]
MQGIKQRASGCEVKRPLPHLARRWGMDNNDFHSQDGFGMAR